MSAYDSHIKVLLWLAFRLFQWIARSIKSR
jgi:hypothetical protein